MNKLEEIYVIIKNFIEEKQQTINNINAIEERRTQLAQERNEKKSQIKQTYSENLESEINLLGNEISRLGNESQELQNKINNRYIETKKIINMVVDSEICEQIRGIRKVEELKQELETQIKEYTERKEKYNIQQQEFLARCGRLPELSEAAKEGIRRQEEKCKQYANEIEMISGRTNGAEELISALASVKNEFARGNFAKILENNHEKENSYIEKNEQELIEETSIENSKLENESVEDIEDIVVENIENEIVEAEDVMLEEKKQGDLEESVILPFVEESEGQEENAPEMIEEVIKEQVENVSEVEENLDAVEIEPINEESFEEIQLSEIEPINELQVEEIEPIEELKVEEIAPIEELEVEELDTVEDIVVEPLEPIQDMKIEDLQIEEDVQDEKMQEEKIVTEQIAQEQHQDENIENVEQIEPEEARSTIEETESEIVQYVQEENPETSENIEEIQKIEEKENIEEEIILPEVETPKIEENISKASFAQKVTLLGINAKFENDEIVYIAQASDGKILKIYPAKMSGENMLLRDKANREEIKEVLINYAVSEYRTLDKSVIKKVDPIVCELLVRFAKAYNYDGQNLIYNYAMSFSKSDESEMDLVPQITYNFSFMENTKYSKKEKDVLAKICKNGKKNEKIEIIGYATGMEKIKYIFKRTFNINAAKQLNEGKF